MTTITLPPEIKKPLTEEAGRRGTRAELLALDSLRERFASAEAVRRKACHRQRRGASHRRRPFMTFCKDFIGVLDSGEHTPGAGMSTDTGRKFAEGMVKKRQEGHI